MILAGALLFWAAWRGGRLRVAARSARAGVFLTLACAPVRGAGHGFSIEALERRPGGRDTPALEERAILVTEGDV